MKNSYLKISLLVALAMPLAQALADNVKMADSEDLNAFDRLVSTQHAPMNVSHRVAPKMSSNVGSEINRESKKLQASAVSKAFSKTIRGQGVGYSQSNAPGAATAANTGAGSDDGSGKGEPGVTDTVHSKKHSH